MDYGRDKRLTDDVGQRTIDVPIDVPRQISDKLISWASDIEPETIRQAEKPSACRSSRVTSPRCRAPTSASV
jgi:hypothetical protein